MFGAVLALTGCVTRQSFMPAENVTDLTQRGYWAARYEVAQRDGQIVEVKVWSGGTFLGEDEQGAEATLAHVGFVIDNASSVRVRLEPADLRLEVTRTGGGERLEPLRPMEIEGDTNVAPDEERNVEAIFRLPDGVGATDVRDFQLRWALRAEGQRYAQRTPFLRSEPQPVRRYYYGYTPYFYDPFYYPYWGGRVYIYRGPAYYYHAPRYRFYERHPGVPRRAR